MESSAQYLLRSFCTSIRYTVGALHRVVMGYVVSVWMAERQTCQEWSARDQARDDIYNLSSPLLPANHMV